MTEPTEPCPEAQRLLDIYTAALEQFHKNWPPFSIDSSSADPKFESLKQAREAARNGLFAAGKSYQDHLNRHGCRKP